MERVVFCIVLGFPCFFDPPPYRGTGDGSFRRSPLAEFGVGARPFADETLCRRVGQAWRGRATTGGPVALGRAVPKRGIPKQAQL